MGRSAMFEVPKPYLSTDSPAPPAQIRVNPETPDLNFQTLVSPRP